MLHRAQSESFSPFPLHDGQTTEPSNLQTGQGFLTPAQRRQLVLPVPLQTAHGPDPRGWVTLPVALHSAHSTCPAPEQRAQANFCPPSQVRHSMEPVRLHAEHASATRPEPLQVAQGPLLVPRHVRQAR